MRQFHNALFKFCLVFFLTNLVFFTIYSHVAQDTRIASTIDKEARLKETAGVRRLIFVGGSSLAYGLDSHLIKKQVGVEVVNMGVQASLGLDFMINQVKGSLKKKDIVVLNLEPGLLGTIPMEGQETILKLFILRPEVIGTNFKFKHISIFFNNYHILMSDIIKDSMVSAAWKLLDKRGYRNQTNQYGDYIGHEGADAIWLGATEEQPCFQVERKALDRINEFQRFCKENSVKLYINWAPIARSRLNNSCQSILEEVDQHVSVPIIGDRDSMILPDSLFFDTAHHLKYENRTILTYRIVKYFKNKNI